VLVYGKLEKAVEMSARTEEEDKGKETPLRA